MLIANIQIKKIINANLVLKNVINANRILLNLKKYLNRAEKNNYGVKNV